MAEFTIAKDVFITAMTLMDEQSDDGTFVGYPDEYKTKAWIILSLLQAELLPVSIYPISTIVDEDSELQVDDKTARTAMAYGLAAHLLMTEDQNRAAFFNARYDELKRNISTKIESITDVYNVLNGMQ